MSHRYQPGAQVRLTPSLSHRGAAEGVYEVMRQLPSSGDGENQYRIKSAHENHERVVKESDLERP
jgi:hypothetical protein